ncbi:beta-hydroxyacyl-ACP dehydratase [Nocardia crassostreae]|uniref:beta-hydroxyacyl-ACP dehydratase n=1 Tax=Nocardia crassostreae TaxID=53428 RepID=UPI0012FC1206|nr:beta-hydroxyacyl-ACP dehydratase [Nocardia crassostreae]
MDELIPYERVVARKAISGCEPCYAELSAGLSQTELAYPRSLLLESFGQSGAVLWLESLRRDNIDFGGQLIFAALRNTSFHRLVHPSDTVRHIVRVDHIIGDNVFVSGETMIGAEPVMTVGEAIVSIRPTVELAGIR